jgi:tRNA (guanine-N7-)-methyltransferase
LSEDTAALPHRAIRSFVVRAGRMSDAQTRAIETLMPRYGVAFAKAAPAHATNFFAVERPLIVEIGFGMGVATAEIAKNHPENNYLGIEVHPPGVGNLLKLIEANALTNLRVIQHDAVEVLEHMITSNAVDGFHIYFPDPWHKTRHNKRRLIQPPFVAFLAEKLKRGAYIHLATDWEPYAHWMLDALNTEPRLKNASTRADGFVEKPSWRPTTKFETRGVKLGHGVWDLLYTKT